MIILDNQRGGSCVHPDDLCANFFWGLRGQRCCWETEFEQIDDCWLLGKARKWDPEARRRQCLEFLYCVSLFLALEVAELSDFEDEKIDKSVSELWSMLSQMALEFIKEPKLAERSSRATYVRLTRHGEDLWERLFEPRWSDILVVAVDPLPWHVSFCYSFDVRLFSLNTDLLQTCVQDFICDLTEENRSCRNFEFEHRIEEHPSGTASSFLEDWLSKKLETLHQPWYVATVSLKIQIPDGNFSTDPVIHLQSFYAEVVFAIRSLLSRKVDWCTLLQKIQSGNIPDWILCIKGVHDAAVSEALEYASSGPLPFFHAKQIARVQEVLFSD